MNPAALKARARRLRRDIEGLREEARTGLGLVRRSAGLERRAPLGRLFEPEPVDFTPYRPPHPIEGFFLPATVVTPVGQACMHTFFDVCPLSPSGRYLAVTRLPFEHRAPLPGDVAEVCVVDLEAQTLTPVHRTGGWALQLGANLQWHPTSDRFLYANDLVNGRGVGVGIDLEAREARTYAAPFYAIDPGGKAMFGPALDLVNRTQAGYGVPEPFLDRRQLGPGASANEGLWRTDLETGRVDLFLSVAEIVAAQPDRDLLRRGRNALFHTKIGPDGRRLFQVLRSNDLPDRPGVWRARIVTFDADGNDLRLALPMEAWDRGGHHPSWLPDGDRILMNLVPEGESSLRFVRFRHDGTGLETVGAERGSGHPSLRPSGRWLLTDAYLNEGFGSPGGTAPLRLIDLEHGEARTLAEVDCGPPGLGSRRCDPHPVWSPDGRRIVANAMVEGRRAVLLFDAASLPGPTPVSAKRAGVPVDA
ncbi:MAG: PD40 domain-containing protein [Geminicoccaceae bacterium]|nr:PD40 domain-containing protein [Geminicoccaceae bacterium]